MGTLKISQDSLDLKSFNRQWKIANGPFNTAEFGHILPVNILGSEQKICSYDCAYCELGQTQIKMSHIKKMTTFPTLQEIDTAVRQHVVQATREKKPVEFLAFVGNGESTLYPNFEEAAHLLKKIRDDLLPGTKTALFSNGTTLDIPKVLRGTQVLDEKIIKFDAGNDEALMKINSPLTRITVSKLILGLKKLKNMTLQSMFLNGAIDNTQESEIEDWIEVVGIIKPKMVHIHTMKYVPPTSGLIPVPRQRLKEIAEIIHRRTQIKTLVFS